MAVNVEAIEAAMAAGREILKHDPRIDSIAVSDISKGSAQRITQRVDTVRAEVVARVGKKDAVIQAVPVEQGGETPDRVRAIRLSLTRVDCGTQTRTAVFKEPVRLTPGGVYLEKARKGKDRLKGPLFERLNLGMFFGTNSDQKALRAMGVSFR